MASIQKQTTFIFITDPLHIGTGGYRLGRVDNTIIREPGTNLPKIPGTSLSGAARAYAATRLKKITCAGQGSKDIPHCGLPTCPICYTFGSVIGDNAYKGTVNIYDAHILFFPTPTQEGLVWVTTRGALENSGFDVSKLPDPGEDKPWVTLVGKTALNFGWLMLDVESHNKEILVFPKIEGIPQTKEGIPQPWDWLKERLAVVHENIFAPLVNSNLEVRTSVSIDPFTGAAKSGALFTYEALPRATILHFDVVEDDYRDPDKGKPAWPINISTSKVPPGEEWKRPLDVVNGGLKLAAWLGMGGMSTRGFGRFKIIGSTIDVWNCVGEAK